MKKRVKVKAWRKPPLETKDEDEKLRRAGEEAYLARGRKNDKPKGKAS